MATIFRSKVVRDLGRLRPNATFLTVHRYMNNFGEVSNFSMCFHIDYLGAVRRAKALLEKYTPSSRETANKPFSVDHLRTAKEELLDSFGMSLQGSNPLATSAHAYVEVTDATGKIIPGIKLHREQDILHLWGFGVHKVVLSSGHYPRDNRSPLTMAKDELRNMTPLGNFVQFKLTPGKFETLTVEGITVRELDVLRDYQGKFLKKHWRKEETSA